jgi:DNA helicase-2/ATP-dependent DNA helicase PcrA
MVNRLGIELERGNSVVAEARALIDKIDLYGDLRSASPTMKAAQKRIDNVESLLASLSRHQERDPGRNALIEYLRKLSLESSDDDAKEAGNSVTMTTLHGSKGLEFPVVFLVGWEEELLPHARTLMATAADVSNPEHSSDVGEERRLAYVGITRAQRVLYVSRSVVRVLRGKPVPRTPSRFLTEIPAELMQERNIADELEAPVEADELSAFFSGFASDFADRD